MEPRGCNGGNQRQMDRATEPQKPAQSVAMDCHRLPERFRGREGVDGSSPSEGFRKFLLISSFRCRSRRQGRASASTERPRAGESVPIRLRIAVAERITTASVQRPRNARSSASASVARLRARGCRGRDGRSGNRSSRCSSRQSARRRTPKRRHEARRWRRCGATPDDHERAQQLLNRSFAT
jgi:hypothetical protein